MKSLVLPILCLFAFSAGCSKKDAANEKQPRPTEASDKSDSRFHGELSQLTPKLVAEFSDYEDGNIRCAGYGPGDVILQNSPGRTAVFCLNDLKVGDDEYLDEIAAATQYDSVYVAILSSTVEGVTDISYVAIFENETILTSRCGGTYHSSKTLQIASGSSEVDKSNLNQMQSLVSGTGICPSVFLHSPADRTRVRTTMDGKTVDLALVKIYGP